MIIAYKCYNNCLLYTSPQIVTILIWKYLYNPNFGFNSILRALGMGGLTHNWLNEKSTALICIILIGFPFISSMYFLIMHTGLNAIGDELYEAAIVDGATSMEVVRYIHLPLSLIHISFDSMMDRLQESFENEKQFTSDVSHEMCIRDRTHGVNDGFYPLGSCTMKYNPKINERTAALNGFTGVHPLQPEHTVQGCLEVLKTAEQVFCEITGMDRMKMCIRDRIGGMVIAEAAYYLTHHTQFYRSVEKWMDRITGLLFGKKAPDSGKESLR